jgi:hypothetical protein
MKIWKEFNSSHSDDLSIVGTFENVNDAKKAFDIIEDFCLSSWEERYPSVKEFNKHWSTFNVNLPYILTQDDYQIGVDNEPDIRISGKSIEITHLRNDNIAGIIKLMRLAGTESILIK